MSDAWHDAGEPLNDGETRVCEVANRGVLLVRQGAALHAIDAVCPHKFAALEDGAWGDGCVTCPQHDASFDVTTGRASEPWAGRLAVHAAREANGRLQVRLGD